MMARMDGRRWLYLGALLLGAMGFVSIAAAEDEKPLFSGDGTAAAYIAVDDELTIYLWGGKPVAYLEADPAGGFHVFGFNGKHLGWFVNGVIWNHSGNGSCATAERLNSTHFEPFKAFKQFKPFKSYTQYAPYRPAFSNSFGDLPCDLLLAAGGN